MRILENKKDKKIFIETTIMTDYLLKDKNKVNNVLYNYNRKITSNYVRMEFKKTPLNYLIYLHNKAVSCKNITEVHEAINKLSSNYHKYRLLSTLENVTNFYKNVFEKRPSEIIIECGNMTLNEYLREKAISHFSLLIRKCWRKFDETVDEIINPMECFVDIQPPYKKGRIYRDDTRTCKKSQNKCNIRGFINENRGTFNNILNKLQEMGAVDQETKKRRKSLKRILRTENKQVTIEDCRACSDAIIAVEAPEGAAIFNNNKKHYDPICDAIGKKSIGYE